MRTLIAKQHAAGLSEAQRSALVSLLEDEDPAVYQIIRKKLISFGPAACQWLQPHLLSSDPVMRRRCLEIVHVLGRQNSDERFLDFCLHNGEDLDLERGLALLAQTQYPGMNAEAYRALLDCWAADLRERIDDGEGADLALMKINRMLFHELGFAGQEQAGANPENSYLNRVIDRRAGSAISLCAVYLLVARRLKLPVTGIGLPGHFLCRYQSPTRECYIDVYRRGKFLTKEDCIRHLLATQHSLGQGYLTPVSPRRILLRMCANLHQTYAHLEMAEEAARIQRYLLALAK